VIDLKEIIRANKLNLKELFNKYDKSVNQMLDQEELANLMRLVAKDLPDKDLEKIFAIFDKNKDGKVSLKEFESLLFESNEPSEQQKKKALKLIKQISQSIKETKVDLQTVYDSLRDQKRSNDKQLTLQEFGSFVRFFDSKCLNAEIKLVFEQFDKDNSGTINY